jgi:hypothetical protein
MYLADLRGTDQCWLHGGSGSIVAFSLFFIRSLVYVFYITGGPRDLMPYIPTLLYPFYYPSVNYNSGLKLCKYFLCTLYNFLLNNLLIFVV